MSAIEFYGEESSDSKEFSPEKLWNPWAPDKVRVVFFRDNSKSQVLMTHETGWWDLPWFSYKTGLEEGYRSTRICRDFAKRIGQERRQFVYVAELIGLLAVWDGEKQWSLKAVVIEAADMDETPLTHLPSDAKIQWTDCTFLNELVEGIPEDEPSMWVPGRTDALQAVLKYSSQEQSFRLSLLEPRLLLGWFRKARNFLVSTIETEGEALQGSVTQYQSTMASTVLEATTQSGKMFFLKAPAGGGKEMSITECLAKEMPEFSVEFVSSNLELGCFVTRGLKVVDGDVEDAVMTLGRMQLESISHLSQLKAAGCPVLDLMTIRRQIVKWLTDYHSSTSSSISFTFEDGGWYILYLCRKLDSIKLPLTLVHGDFSTANVGTGEHRGSTLIYDWEFACISHPLLDFYRFTDFYGKNTMSQKIIDKYLELWTKYAPMKELKEGLEIGRVLGRVLRVCSLWDRADACTHQLHTASLDRWKRLDAVLLYSRLLDLKDNDVEYWKSEEGDMESKMPVDSSNENIAH